MSKAQVPLHQYQSIIISVDIIMMIHFLLKNNIVGLTN